MRGTSVPHNPQLNPIRKFISRHPVPSSTFPVQSHYFLSSHLLWHHLYRPPPRQPEPHLVSQNPDRGPPWIVAPSTPTAGQRNICLWF